MTDPLTLPFDGERFIPGMSGANELEHLHRYALAIALAGSKTVLDIACGEGYGSDMLAEAASRVIGVDLSEQVVKHAQETYQRHNLEFRVGSCAAIPLEDRAVDLVVSFETIEHHTQHQEMFSEISRVLKPGGVLMISSPNKHEYSDVPGFANPFHVKELYLDEFAALLTKNFSNVALYGQRTMHVSAVAKREPGAQPFEHRFTDAYRKAIGTIDRPIYFIAVASNHALPDLPNSLMEASLPDVRSNVFVETSRLQAYWRSDEEDFSEGRAVSLTYPVGGATREYLLGISSSETTIASLRIDLADRPLVCHLSSLHLTNSEGETVWTWDGLPSEFARASECFFLPRQSSQSGGRQSSRGIDLIVTGADPHFEIDLERDLAEKLKSGFELHTEFSTQRFLREYEVDLISLAKDLAAIKSEVSADRSSIISIMDAIKKELIAERSSIVASVAELSSAIAEAQRREAAAGDAQRQTEAQLLRLRSHRWWSLANRIFRFE